jgi:hypothetical protein
MNGGARRHANGIVAGLSLSRESSHVARWHRPAVFVSP